MAAMLNQAGPTPTPYPLPLYPYPYPYLYPYKTNPATYYPATRLLYAVNKQRK